jgi:ComF family protein
MIRALKYGGAVAQGRVLAELFTRCLRRRPDDAWPEVLLPVPLAYGRFCRRGYNQAIELGIHLQRQLHIPLHTDVLVRTRETIEQAGLGRRERRKNLRNAFAVARPLPGRHVAIVDDVVTTGSTVNELARVLKQAGATRVDIWALARAGL